MRIQLLRLLMICIPPLMEVAVAADTPEQDHELIYETVRNLAGEQVEIQKVDTRLRLNNCSGDLTARYPFSRNTTIEVRCTDENGWKIFLSVSGAAYQEEPHSSSDNVAELPTKNPTSVVRQVDAVVARTLLPRGVPIRAADLVLRQFPAHRVRASNFTSTEELIGFEPLQTITAGTMISFNMLAPPYLVKKGDPVTLIFQRGGILVSNEAVALESGELNKKIDVRIPDSGKVVSGVVTQAGVVSVMP